MSYRSVRKAKSVQTRSQESTETDQTIPKNLPRRIQYELNVFENSAAFANYFKLAVVMYLVLLAYFILFKGKGTEATASLMVIGSAAIPIGLWANKKTHGLPIFPVSSLTFIITFGLQFLIQDEFTDIRARFRAGPDELLFAAFTVALFILSGTWTWYLFTRNRRSRPDTFMELLPGRGDILFGVLFSITSLITILVAMEKFPDIGRFYSVLRAINGNVAILSTFILSYRLGQGTLSKKLVILFAVLLFTNLVAMSASLLLIGAISLGAVAVIGFTLGARKLPWIALVCAIPLFYVLHSGKAEMRHKYWSQSQAVAKVTLTDYPAYFLEWFQFGLENILNPTPKVEERADLLERSSLLQILLTAQIMSPEIVPFMKGESYRGIYRLVVPSFLDPSRPAVNEGLIALNIHYGILDRKGAKTTSVGWGLMNESYANYGLWGIFLVGGIMGAFYGFITRISQGLPLLSFQGLFGILALSVSFQTEWAAGVFVSAFFQAVIVLLLLRFTLMEKVVFQSPSSRPTHGRRL